MAPAWTVGCVDTFHGMVHRFPSPDGPCACGEVTKNRRQHVRQAVTGTRDYGTRSAPVLALIEARGGLTVSQIADAMRRPIAVAACLAVHREQARAQVYISVPGPKRAQ